MYIGDIRTSISSEIFLGDIRMYIYVLHVRRKRALRVFAVPPM